jgi:hypothetical protein
MINDRAQALKQIALNFPKEKHWLPLVFNSSTGHFLKKFALCSPPGNTGTNDKDLKSV